MGPEKLRVPLSQIQSWGRATVSVKNFFFSLGEQRARVSEGLKEPGSEGLGMRLARVSANLSPPFSVMN